MPPAKRLSRAERERREKERHALRRRLVVAASLVAALVGAVLLTRADEDAQAIDAIEAGSCEYDTAVDEDPPASGDVDDVEPARPGFYLPGDAPSDLALVRAMRQGFVVLWYLDSTSPEQLQGVSDRFGRDLIVVPRSRLGGAVALTAWERRAVCTSFEEESVVTFTEAFRDRGPEKGFL